jgi:Raf kinase inhibitor-like YbhB/YbcL family protein
MKNILFFFALTSLSCFGKNFNLQSPDLKKNLNIGKKFIWNKDGCHGDNVSPSLTWKNPPKGTKSFAITVFDPDVKSGSGWWHWMIINIPAKTKSLNTGASKTKLIPQNSIEIRNDFGEIGWGGPCPPPGETHHYVFTIYALNRESIEYSPTTTPAHLGVELEKFLIKKTYFRVKYSR